MAENEPRRENTPAEAAANAVSGIENRDAANPVISSGLGAKFKEFWKDEKGIDSKDLVKTSGVIAGVSLVESLVMSYGVLRGVFKFAKDVIQKKGNVGFGAGYNIGEEMFSPDKKDKK